MSRSDAAIAKAFARAGVTTRSSANTLPLLDGTLLTLLIPATKTVEVAHFKVDRFYQFLQWDHNEDKMRKKSQPVPQQLIAIGSIIEVRAGQHSSAFTVSSFAKGKQNQSFSVYFMDGLRFRALHFVANSSEEAATWVDGLAYMVSLEDRKDDADYTTDQERQRIEWALLGLREDSTYPLKEFLDFPADRLSFKISPLSLKMIVQACAKQRDPELRVTHLDYPLFCQVYDSLTSRTADMRNILAQEDISVLTLKELRAFFNTLQNPAHISYSDEQIKKIITEFEADDERRAANSITLHNLGTYLRSDAEHVRRAEDFVVSQHMNLPFSCYFIKTLTYPQLYGGFSAADPLEGIIRALLAGFRCFKLRLWKGSKNHPVVHPANFPHVKVPLGDVLQVLAKYAFRASKYPFFLILSGELEPKSVAKLNEIVTSTLGHLVEETTQLDLNTSPEALIRRILIVNEVLEKENKQLIIRKRLGDQGVFAVGLKSNSLEQLKEGGHAFEIWDVQAPTLHAEYEAHPEELRRFTTERLVYAEPVTGLKNSPSVFLDYIKLWEAGVQLLAADEEMPTILRQLYYARFVDNGGCGYVLKPRHMHSAAGMTHKSSEPLSPSMSVSIRVISAQQLRLESSDSRCYYRETEFDEKEIRRMSIDRGSLSARVNMYLHGSGPDAKNEANLSTSMNTNGVFAPVFLNAKEVFRFDVFQPDLCMIRFLVDGERVDEVFGHAVVPLASLQPGYHYIRLKNKLCNTVASSTVLVHIRIASYSLIEGRKELLLCDLQSLREWPLTDRNGGLPDPWGFIGSEGREVFQKSMQEKEDISKIAEMMANFAEKSRTVLMRHATLPTEMAGFLENVGAVYSHSIDLDQYHCTYFRLPKSSVWSFSLCNVYLRDAEDQFQWLAYFYIY